MSFYIRHCGVCPAAGALAHMLGIHLHCIPQFRDCYIEDGHIVILARCGGVLQEDYLLEIECLRSLPTFLRECELYDDETYVKFTYRVPAAHREAFALLQHAHSAARDPERLLIQARMIR